MSMYRDDYYEACITALAALAECEQRFSDHLQLGGDYGPLTPDLEEMTRSQMQAQARRWGKAFDTARQGMVASFGDAGDFSD